MLSTTKEPSEKSSRSKRTIVASIAALGSVVLASSCCLPLLPFLFAAGAAGTSAFFVKVRPFLLAASVLFIAFGFYQAWRAKQCKCQPSVLSTILLWSSAIIVLAFTLFPQAIANFLANLLA
jgi:cytochrome bd-type quinol oxidase subunit 2